jgi:CheY-like chemotaxis protein
MGEERHTVLIADDYEADRLLLKEVIRRHTSKLQVVAEVGDGEQVVAYLSGKGQYADREAYPLPQVLILDIRMPRMTGFEVLEWLKARDFPRMKIAVLADSSTATHRPRALELGAEHFFSKVMGTNELIRLVKQLQDELEGGEKGGVS